MRFWDCVSQSVDSKHGTCLVRLCIFSSWIFTVAIRSSIVIVDAEECGRAGVLEFNDFGVAVSFGVVVADLGIVERDDDLFETILLVERLVLDLSFFCFVCHGLYCVLSGGYLDCVRWFFYFFLVFWTF